MKRILLVADLRGWIFERHCKEIQKRLTEYHIDITYCRGGVNVAQASAAYDLVYILDPMPIAYPPPEKTILGLRCEFLYKDHPEGAQGLYENGWAGKCASIKDKCCIFHVVNQRQMRDFKDVVTDKPLMLAQHGVDETIFDRSKCKPVVNDVLNVGTSGRSRSDGKKGFDIVSKACEKVGARHLTTRYQGGRLTKEQMPQFYNSIDVYACMSKTEGLCNPILESGAMGVPVISTTAGAATEMINDGWNGLLINRDLESLVKALQRLKSNFIECRAMGNRFEREILDNWTWDVRIEDFRRMFEAYFDGV